METRQTSTGAGTAPPGDTQATAQPIPNAPSNDVHTVLLELVRRMDDIERRATTTSSNPGIPPPPPLPSSTDTSPEEEQDEENPPAKKPKGMKPHTPKIWDVAIQCAREKCLDLDNIARTLVTAGHDANNPILPKEVEAITSYASPTPSYKPTVTTGSIIATLVTIVTSLADPLQIEPEVMNRLICGIVAADQMVFKAHLSKRTPVEAAWTRLRVMTRAAVTILSDLIHRPAQFNTSMQALVLQAITFEKALQSEGEALPPQRRSYNPQYAQRAAQARPTFKFYHIACRQHNYGGCVFPNCSRPHRCIACFEESHTYATCPAMSKDRQAHADANN